MNLLSLYYFVELAKELHVTNVAQRLYISQQNLSQHIQRLEHFYGVELFYRKPRLALTYAGEQLYAAAIKILAEESDFVNRLSSISKKRAGNLKIGIPAYRGQICLPDILSRFHKLWPNVSIQLIDKASEKMEEMVRDGELDFYIGVIHPNSAQLDILPLLDDSVFLVCSDELLKRYYTDSCEELKKRSRKGANLKWFSHVPFLLPEPRMRLRKLIDECFLDAKVTPEIFLESSSTELLISLYPNHYGAFFCTQMRLPLLAASAPDANTFPMILKGEFVQHHIGLVRHKDRFLPDYVNDFIEITKDVFHEISNIRIQS